MTALLLRGGFKIQGLGVRLFQRRADTFQLVHRLLLVAVPKSSSTSSNLFFFCEFCSIHERAAVQTAETMPELTAVIIPDAARGEPEPLRQTPPLFLRAALRLRVGSVFPLSGG